MCFVDHVASPTTPPLTRNSVNNDRQALHHHNFIKPTLQSLLDRSLVASDDEESPNVKRRRSSLDDRQIAAVRQSDAKYRRRNSSSYLTARREIEENDVGAHSLGRMNVVCDFCDALFWKDEHHFCCNHGKLKLDTLPPLPDPINALLIGTNSFSVAFKKNIRAYNSAFAFTSIGADIPASAGWQPHFSIHGQTCHR